MASMPNMKIGINKETRTPRDRFGLRGLPPPSSKPEKNKNGSKNSNKISEDDVEAEDDALLDAFDNDDDDEEDDVTSFIRPGVITNNNSKMNMDRMNRSNEVAANGRLMPASSGVTSAGKSLPTGRQASNAARAAPSFRTFAARPKNGQSQIRRPILQLVDSVETPNQNSSSSSTSSSNGLQKPSSNAKRPTTLDYCSKNGRRYHSHANGSRISYDTLSRMGATSSSRHQHCRRLIAPSDNDDEVEIDTMRLGTGAELGDEEPLASHFGPIYSKENLIKNLALLSVACTLVSSGFYLFPGLNSSLYSSEVEQSEANLYAPAVLFASATLATLFTTPMVLDTKLRPKWCLVLASVVIAVGAALRAPKTSAMSPVLVLISSAFEGLFWGIAQNAGLVSLLNVASKLSCMDRRCPERVHLKIAVIFHLCVATFWVWGNGLTSALLSAFDMADVVNVDHGSHRAIRGVRVSMAPPIVSHVMVNSSRAIKGDDEVTFTSLELGPPWTPISGTAVTLTLIGGLAAAAMDDMKRAVVQDPLERNALAKHLASLRAAFNDLTTLLTLPLSFFVGLESSVLLADFNYTFVTLRMGTKYIGFVLVAYGFSFLVGSYIIGILKRPARRLAFLWAATAFFAGVLLTARLMTSSKMADDPPLFYVLAAVWGLCSGVWDTLIKTFLHATNGQNLHTHILHLSTVSFGLTLGFALYPALCMQAKLWVLAGLMIPAVVCQAWAEITFARQTEHDVTVAAL